MIPDEVLFERFRARGDAEALGELFDRAAQALLRIAMHLARDPAAAEDLVQSTFLLAIEARNEWDGRRPWLPWLFGILHNRARIARRREERSPDPRRLPADTSADPVRAAETSEFDAALDAAIGTLPEIYQPVLRLYLAYEHEPAEIAHALGRPPGTVRSQLARGLELLRRALPPTVVGSAALGITASPGLAAMRQTVLAHASAAVPAAATAGAMLGGAMAMKKMTLGLAAAVIAAATWLVWPRPEAALSVTDATRTAEAPVHAPLPQPGQAGPVGDPALHERRMVDVAAVKTGTGSLRIHCRYGEDGSAAWGVQVEATPWGVPDGALLQRIAVTDNDGSVVVDDLPAGRTWVQADRGGTLDVQVIAGTTTAAGLVIPPGLDVRGRVVDGHAAPVPGASIWLSDHARSYCEGRYVARADGAGRFHLRSVEPERFLGAAAPGLRAAIAQPMRGEVGSTIEVELVLRGAGAALLGRVSDAQGRPVAAARVLVGFQQQSLAWHPALHSEFRPPPELVTDSRGEFRADGFAAGSETDLWVRAYGFCTMRQHVVFEKNGDTTVTVRLQRGGTVSGRVTDGGGRSLAGVYVSSHPVGLGGVDSIDFSGPGWAMSGAVTGADGNYRIAALPPGLVRFVARSDDKYVRGEIEVSEGGDATWNPLVGDVALRGQVVDERGQPLAGFRVTAQAPRGRGNMTSAVTDAEGRFQCQGTADVPFVLTFSVGGDGLQVRPAAIVRGVLPGGDSLLVRVPDAAMPSATISGALLDSDGSPLARGTVHLTAPGREHAKDIAADPVTGAFRIGPLPPGTYALRVGIGDGPRRGRWGAPFALRASQDLDVGVLQMPVTGSLAVVVTDVDGKALERGSVNVEDSSEWQTSPYSTTGIQQGRALLSDLAPGACRIRVSGPDLPDLYVPVVVRAGEETPVAVTMPAGVLVRLAHAAATEPTPIHVSFAWALDGVPWECYTNWIEGTGTFQWPRRLLPGSYQVVATSETGKREVSTFVVGAGDTPGREIPIKLP